jgi:hypothetical protein
MMRIISGVKNSDQISPSDRALQVIKKVEGWERRTKAEEK